MTSNLLDELENTELRLIQEIWNLENQIFLLTERLRDVDRSLKRIEDSLHLTGRETLTEMPT